MNREEIIKLALEAGCIGPDGGDPNGLWEPHGHENVTELMMTFAALVAAAEREACARLCDAVQKKNEDDGAWMWEARNCAAAIRARSKP